MQELASQFTFPTLQGRVKILRGNSNYRIGDIVYKKGASWRHAAEEILSNPLEFEETVLYKYLSQNGIDRPRDVNLFFEILMEIGNKKGWSQPQPEDLVMHVRLGDVLDPKNPIGPERIFHYYGKFFAGFTNNALKAKRLVVCTALHYCDYGGLYDHGLVSEVNSRQLLSNIFYEANARSMEVDIHSNYNIDMDIYYLCKAKNLALSISDFSRVVAKMLEINGVEVRLIPYIYNLHASDRNHIDWSQSLIKEREILGID